MKEMIKRVREEKGGFTLAELLIVVAILLVLIAIAVPMFTGALSKAENAVATANKNSAEHEALSDYLLGDKASGSGATYYAGYGSDGKEVYFTETQAEAVGDTKYAYTITITDDGKGNVVATATQTNPPTTGTDSSDDGK